MWRPTGPVYAGIVFGLVLLVLVSIFFATTAQSGFKLQEGLKERLAITPATTVSRFPHHFIAGLFHTNLGHIGFNLAIFTIGFWLTQRHTDPLVGVATAYGIGIFTVFLLHLVLVLPLAQTGLPYATRALDLPLVGFSVIAYATLGMGLIGLDRTIQLGALGAVLLFELAAAIWFTAPFISVYHVAGALLGLYIRSLWAAPTGS
jgi:hypothetical protein